MRQTFGEAANLSTANAAPTLPADGTNLVTTFKAGMRCAKYMLTVVATVNTVVAELWAYTPRSGGVWGIHRVPGLDGVTLAAGKTYHFPVDDFGGFSRAQLVRASGTGTIAASIAEVINGSMTVGD